MTGCILGDILHEGKGKWVCWLHPSKMRVTIRQKDLKITPALTKYIELKILKPIRRRLKEGASTALPILDLEFSRTTSHHRKGKICHAEANLSLGKKIIRAEVDDENMRSACDLLEQALDHELRTFHGKRKSLERRDARRVKRETRFAPTAQIREKGRVRNESG